jgi:hypothetical protein
LIQAATCWKELEKNALKSVFWDSLAVVGRILEFGREVAVVSPVFVTLH